MAEPGESSWHVLPSQWVIPLKWMTSSSLSGLSFNLQSRRTTVRLLPISRIFGWKFKVSAAREKIVYKTWGITSRERLHHSSVHRIAQWRFCNYFRVTRIKQNGFSFAWTCRLAVIWVRASQHTSGQPQLSRSLGSCARLCRHLLNLTGT